MYEARIERDSITQYGERLTTFVITLPRIVLAELNTHKMLSKSSASSRAIPVEKMIARVKEDPFFPVYWGKNQKGMQADVELTHDEIEAGRAVWMSAAESAITHAKKLLTLGVHKQITNRLLEPFMWHTVIISGTDWSNFFHLRADAEAQPEIRESAEMMQALMRASKPKLLTPFSWHTPFIQPDEDEGLSATKCLRVSVGRAARVSYLNHDGKRDVEDDLGLSTRVLNSGHMAPWEHVARPMTQIERELFGRTNWVAEPMSPVDAEQEMGVHSTTEWIARGEVHYLGNFNGWVQARKLIHGEWDMKAFGK